MVVRRSNFHITTTPRPYHQSLEIIAISFHFSQVELSMISSKWICMRKLRCSLLNCLQTSHNNYTTIVHYLPPTPPPPSDIHEVSPQSGSSEGGTLLTIRGTGFGMKSGDITGTYIVNLKYQVAWLSTECTQQSTQYTSVRVTCSILHACARAIVWMFSENTWPCIASIIPRLSPIFSHLQ